MKPSSEIINDRDLLIDEYSNMAERSIRIVHMPTGLVVERRQIKSRVKAMRGMRVELQQKLQGKL